MLDSVDMSYAELDTELFEGDSFDAEFFGDSLFDTGVIDGENNHLQKSNKNNYYFPISNLHDAMLR